MRKMTKFLSAAAMTLSVVALAPATQAAVFAQFSPVSNKTNFLWLNNGGVYAVDPDGSGPIKAGDQTNTGSGGSFFSTATASASVAGATAIAFTLFDDPNLVNLKASLFLTGTAINTPTVYDGATFKQVNVNGSFDVIYTGNTARYLNGVKVASGGTLVTKNSHLLTGTFTNAWLEGSGGAGSFDIDVSNGGHAIFASPYDPFTHIDPDSESFSIHLGANAPGFGAKTPGVTAMKTFRANGGGNFSDVALPEPSSWALMIMGFGGVGAVLRSRRRAAFA